MKPVSQALYRPKGAALEYAPLAVNLYEGCPHRCRYCYVPAMYKRFGKITQTETFHRSDLIRPREGVLTRLLEDVRSGKWERPGPVLLSFTGDVYNNHEGQFRVTRQALEILGEAGFAVRVLTKAGRGLPNRDFDLMKKYGVELGVTLTGMSRAWRDEWEVGAELPSERLALLRDARAAGVRTWVSLEPVIDRAEACTVIAKTHNYACYYRVGKINHHPEWENSVNWSSVLYGLLAELERAGACYAIKDSLWKHANAAVLDRWPKEAL